MTEKNNRILLVDDAVEMVNILRAFLEAAGYRVETAYNGVLALEKLKGFTPDLIILDMDMPKMGGIAFLHEISRADGSPRHPVMVFTGRANMEALFSEMKVEGFVTKPFELEDLQRKIDAVFRRLYGAPSVPAPAGAGKKKSRKVLVIERDRAFFDGLVLALSNAGYEVVPGLGASEKAGEDAARRITAAVRNDPPGAVLAGVPSMNPLNAEFAVAARLQEVLRPAGIPLIIYGSKPSFSGGEAAALMVRESGVHSVVEAASPEKLAQHLDRIFETAFPNS